MNDDEIKSAYKLHPFTDEQIRTVKRFADAFEGMPESVLKEFDGMTLRQMMIMAKAMTSGARRAGGKKTAKAAAERTAPYKMAIDAAIERLTPTMRIDGSWAYGSSAKIEHAAKADLQAKGFTREQIATNLSRDAIKKAMSKK